MEDEEEEEEEVAEEEPDDTQDLALGETAVLADVEVTVYSIDVEAAAEGPQPDAEGDKWVAIDHQICISPDFVAPDYLDTEAVQVSTWPWRIVSDDHRRFEASNTGYDSFPEPACAWGDEYVDPGECLRGWTVFVVNKDAELETVRYENEEHEKASWLIP